MKHIAILLLAAILTGCVTTQTALQTPSGKPEVTISSKDVQAVRRAIISEITNRQYMLTSDSEYLLKFSRRCTGMDAISATIRLGNSYSSDPYYTWVFSILPDKESIRVISDISVGLTNVYGQFNSADLNYGDTAKGCLDLLILIKERVEGPKPDISSNSPKTSDSAK